MQHSLLVGTRKGLFVVHGGSAPWRIAAHHFAGEPVTQVLADPRDGAWYAALRMGHFGVKLRKSVDQGAHWVEIAAPAFPTKPLDGPLAADTTPWNVDMVWELAAGGPSEPGVLWAGCLPGGLFRSTDGGASWQLNRPLWDDPRRLAWMGGGYDHPGIHAIVVDPRDARHLTLAVSTGGVWQTRDAGASWSLTAAGMRADFLPAEMAEEANLQDVHALVQCPAAPEHLWVQHHGGRYRSTDGGAHWQTIAPSQPSGFGFAVAVDPHNPQRAWFVPAAADALRMPVDGRMVVTRTDDGGASFQVFRAGLPQDHACHLVYRHGLAVAADGRTLAMASTTGALWQSTDAGEHWEAISRDLPPVAVVRFAPGG
ncbi:MAG: exo-alpha-sialidase [Rhodoferax sp.]|jgi:photosystem II stability/assembly factor-like uncharacterized protein|nr:exo-alpha-sialidase [Rhodoferax sp.]